MVSHSKNTLAISVNCDASVEKVWAEIADWSGQGKWMLATRVWVTSEITEGVGTSIAAFTGPAHRIYPSLAFLGLLDTMTVTTWQPPFRCHVADVVSGCPGKQVFGVHAAANVASVAGIQSFRDRPNG